MFGESSRNKCYLNPCLLAILAIGWLVGSWGFSNDEVPKNQFLFEPFQGFSKEGMTPILALLQSDMEGRRLLRKTLSKSRLYSVSRLTEILGYCERADLGGDWERRGLFTQDTSYFYRTKGSDSWEDGGTGEAEKLNSPKQFPLLARNQYQTTNFEHLEVAFRPKICLKSGMSVLQTYLVLYHELVHFVGLDHFDQLDLFSFRAHNKKSRFYYHQLAKNGGELKAYLAQLQAFQRLKKRYQIPERWVLESFLDPRGQLDYRDRDAFMDHLLNKAGYRDQLDSFLDQQVLLQYNRAYAWWTYLDKLIDHYDQNYRIIKKNLTNIEEQAEKYALGKQPLPADLASEKKEWRMAHKENRTVRKSYRIEQLRLERFMEKVDRFHPRN